MKDEAWEGRANASLFLLSAFRLLPSPFRLPPSAFLRTAGHLRRTHGDELLLGPCDYFP